MTLKQDKNKILLNEHGKVVQIKIPATTDFSSNLREIIGNHLENDTKFGLKWRYRIQLVTDELINNAIEHGSVEGDEVIIKLTIFNNSNIEITISDSGNGSKKIKAKELLQLVKESREGMIIDPTSNKSIRGRGLAMIVLSWSDSFEYIDNPTGGLTARITKEFTQDCSDEKVSGNNNKIKYPKKIKLEATTF